MTARSSKTNADNQSVADDIQCRLTVGAVNDPLEAEADTVADQVMRMPVNGVVQRKCSHCEEEDRAQMKPLSSFIQKKGRASGNGGNIASETVSNKIKSSKGGGSPLADTTKSFMESRFGTDFSGIRIHTGTEAVQLSSDLNAQAFTVGNNIYFNEGKYSPESDEGKHLLAHELTHTVQQNSTHPLIQRTLRVENPNDPLPGTPARENWEDVNDLITTLSSGFSVNSTGAVGPTNATFCTSPSRTTDNCLCDMHNSANDWKIQIKDDEWPHTDDVNHRVVIQSSRSTVAFGAWGGGAQSGTRVGQHLWRILGHELCGHAWLMEQGIHPPGNIVRRGSRIMSRPSHDPTVVIENQVAQDVLGSSAPERGVHTDTHSGESFGKVTIAEFGTNSSQISSLPSNMAAQIDVAEHFMNTNNFVKADIIGHTDSTGGASGNTSISRQRARNIKNELVSRGIPSARFNVVRGVGSSECTTPSPTPDPACRKVEVFMYIFERSSLRFP